VCVCVCVFRCIRDVYQDFRQMSAVAYSFHCFDFQGGMSGTLLYLRSAVSQKKIFRYRGRPKGN
jgi:hypothetical protein